MLWKNYSYYRKARGKTVDGIGSPDFRRNVTTIAKELTLMERTAFAEGLFFASSPVLYRDRNRMPKPDAAREAEVEMSTGTEAETPLGTEAEIPAGTEGDVT